MRGLIWEKECTSNSTVTADGFHSARWCRWKQFGKLCGTNLLAFAAVWDCRGLAILHRSVQHSLHWFHWWRSVTFTENPQGSSYLATIHANSLPGLFFVYGLVFWEVWHQPLSSMINVWATATENSATANGMLNNRWNRRNLLICDQYYLTLDPPKTQIWSGFAPHSSEGKYNWTDIFMSYCSHKMDKNL